MQPLPTPVHTYTLVSLQNPQGTCFCRLTCSYLCSLTLRCVSALSPLPHTRTHTHIHTYTHTYIHTPRPPLEAAHQPSPLPHLHILVLLDVALQLAPPVHLPQLCLQGREAVCIKAGHEVLSQEHRLDIWPGKSGVETGEGRSFACRCGHTRTRICLHQPRRSTLAVTLGHQFNVRPERGN